MSGAIPARADGCPIPLPVGSVDGTYNGSIARPISTDPTLDQLTGTDMLDGQIIIQLSGRFCQFGLTPEMLLSQLETAYPDTLWSPELLQQRLRVGVSQGRFCENANGTYVLNPNMVFLNPYNQRFQGLVNDVDRLTICQTTVSGNTSGAYRGDEMCCFR